MPPPSPPPDDSPGLIVRTAARLLANGQAAAAAAHLEGLVAAAPAYPAAHVLLARALEASGRESEALAAWHRAHFLVPNSPLVLRERARLLEARVGASQGEPPAAPETAEPSTPHPDETPSSDDALAAAPAGGLPDAHLALAEDEPPLVEAASEKAASEEVASPAVEASEEDSAEAEPVEVDVVPPDGISSQETTAGEAEEPALTESDEEEGWVVVEEIELPPRPVPKPTEPEVAPPETSDAADEAASGLGDTLDALIHQLEDAPRIRPDPTFSGPSVTFDEEIADDMVSETLARIYAAQDQYTEAAAVYEKLAEQRPEQADEMLRRAAEMRAKVGK